MLVVAATSCSRVVLLTSRRKHCFLVSSPISVSQTKPSSKAFPLTALNRWMSFADLLLPSEVCVANTELQVARRRCMIVVPIG